MQTSRLGKERYTTGEYRKYFSPPCCLVMGSGEDVLNFFPKIGGGGCFFFSRVSLDTFCQSKSTGMIGFLFHLTF